MKKILTLAAALVVAACTVPPAEQTVRFHTDLVETGTLTRAADYGEIQTLITSTYPTITPKVWYSETDRVTVPLNQDVNVRVGRWLFAWDPPTIQTMADVMLTAQLALQPYMDISTYVTITPGITEYTLPVDVQSIGFVWDTREVAAVYYNANNGNLPNVKAGFGVYSKNYGVFFLNGGWDSDGSILMLQVRPVDTVAGKVTNFYFSNVYDDWNGNAVYHLQKGHFYVLHPGTVTDITGSFGVSFPDWICDLD